jgi:heme oxygenase
VIAIRRYAGLRIDGYVGKRARGRPLTKRSGIRTRLRESTAPVHNRLHRHPGFAAVASGSISLGDYRLLLSRLWGFHYAFERVLGQARREIVVGVAVEGRARSQMLESDLVALGADRDSVRDIPQCLALRPPRSAPEFMGALYVAEGSTLGGLQLARALEPLIAAGGGRSFFQGYGDQHGAMWRSFLFQLEACASSEEKEAAIVDGALRTFCDFEIWMEGWSQQPDAGELTAAEPRQFMDGRRPQGAARE